MPAAALQLRRPAPSPIPRPMSIAQYMQMPDDGNKYELFTGELIMSPSYFYPHGTVTGTIFAKLQRFLKSKPLGVVGLDTDVVMRPLRTVLRPDICYISNERRAIIRGHIHGAPDLAIEITSPSNWQNDVHFKRVQYERFGIREYWVIDIADQRNRAFQWTLRRGRLEGGLLEADAIRSRVLPGFLLRLKPLWKLAALGAP